MIGDTLWYLGGSNNSNHLASDFYNDERGTTIYSNTTYSRDTSWIGKVGLIYPSDYGYAISGGSTTSRNSCLMSVTLYNWSDYSDCYSNDWLYYSSKYRYSITPSFYYSYAVYGVTWNGFVTSYSTDSINAIFPVVF